MNKFYLLFPFLLLISSVSYGQTERVKTGTAFQSSKQSSSVKTTNAQEQVDKSTYTPTIGSDEDKRSHAGAAIENPIPKQDEKIDSGAVQSNDQPNILNGSSGMEYNVTYEKVELSSENPSSNKEMSPLKVTKSVNYKESVLREDNPNKPINTTEDISPGKRTYLRQYLEALEVEIAQNLNNPNYNMSEKLAERDQLKKLLEP